MLSLYLNTEAALDINNILTPGLHFAEVIPYKLFHTFELA